MSPAKAQKVANQVQQTMARASALCDLIRDQDSWAWARTEQVDGKLKVDSAEIKRAAESQGWAELLGADSKAWKQLFGEDDLKQKVSQMMAAEKKIADLESFINKAWTCKKAFRCDKT